jgi:hypothetical protein
MTKIKQESYFLYLFEFILNFLQDKVLTLKKKLSIHYRHVNNKTPKFMWSETKTWNIYDKKT